MPDTTAMQPFLTLQGGYTSSEDITQPASGWVDGQAYKEIAFDILLLRHFGATTPASLIIETATSPAGQWVTLTSFTQVGYSSTMLYCTAREGGSKQFRRFIRWRLDRSAASTPWETCFRICATMKE